MALWTLLSWCAVGGGVAAVLMKRDRGSTRWSAVARVPLHVLLWPLFLPTLLPDSPAQSGALRSAWNERIEAAEATLGEALGALARDLDDPLSLEWARVTSLGRALRTAAARLTEIDAALALPMNDGRSIREEILAASASADGAVVAEVLQRRLDHVERLEAIARQARVDLERALAEATALASRLTLLRYEDGRAGAAAGRARELTNTVDDLCRVLAEARSGGSAEVLSSTPVTS